VNDAPPIAETYDGQTTEDLARLLAMRNRRINEKYAEIKIEDAHRRAIVAELKRRNAGG
jgi:hypothetical protein